MACYFWPAGGGADAAASWSESVSSALSATYKSKKNWTCRFGLTQDQTWIYIEQRADSDKSETDMVIATIGTTTHLLELGPGGEDLFLTKLAIAVPSTLIYITGEEYTTKDETDEETASIRLGRMRRGDPVAGVAVGEFVELRSTLASTGPTELWDTNETKDMKKLEKELNVLPPNRAFIGGAAVAPQRHSSGAQRTTPLGRRALSVIHAYTELTKGTASGSEMKRVKLTSTR